jgi:hypothetical protein
MVFRKFIISNIFLGGTDKYISELFKNYKNLERVSCYAELESKNICSTDILFVQHLINYIDITVDHLIEIKEKTGCKIIVTAHDFSWLTPNFLHNDKPSHIIYMQENIEVQPLVKKLFNRVDMIITPSEFTFSFYKKYFDTNNIVICPHNDFCIDENIKRVPLIHGNVINIASVRSYTEVKGCENIDFLEYNCGEYKGYKINVMRTGWHIPVYQEHDFFQQLEQYNIHGLLHLNKYGESYDYSLTKSFNSGLPILYNNVGSYKTRIKEKEHYFKVMDHESQYYDRELLRERFENMLDYIIENNGTGNEMNKSFNFECRPLYNLLFNL